MRKKVEKWIDLSGLPRKYGVGANKDKQVINWDECANQKYKIKFIYDGTEDEIEIIGYNKDFAKLTIKINNSIFDIATGNLIKCRFGTMLGKKTSDFKIEIGTHIKDKKRDMVIIDRKHVKNERCQNLKYYKYKCNKCTYEGLTLEGNLLNQKTGCGVCSGDVVVEGINDIPTTTPWMIQYFQGGYNEAKMYTSQSNLKIKPICPDCGRIKDRPMSIGNIYRKHSISCICGNIGISYPEKIMNSILKQINIVYETEYSPNWIKPKRYDFYFKLNNDGYIVEMDGMQHKKEKFLNSKWSNLKKQKETDAYKDKLAKEHDVKVIRIDCEFSDLEFIKNNILNSELNDIFNLSKIDWNKCEEFASSNLVKKVCEVKRDNSEMSANQIANIFKMSNNAVISYLKKGTKLGWCEYNPKGKSVEIYNNGVKKGTFSSCSELERQSEKLFGVKLNISKISMVCNGKIKTYKGFTFKYVEHNRNCA